MSEKTTQQVQSFGRKKNATAVATASPGKGFVHVNGKPIQLLEPASLRMKVWEPIFLLGARHFQGLNIRVRVTGGGSTSQVLAVRQAISKALIAYYQKYHDEFTKRELKQQLIMYDKTLLVADPRRMEPKKFGGPGARARYQKSYR